MPSNVEPAISIVMSAYSLEQFRFLRRLLASVVEQKRNDLEVIVVVDGPNAVLDAMYNLVRSMNIMNSKIVHLDRNSGASAARNAGAAVARAKLIAFLDDDVVLDRNWASNVLQVFSLYRGLDALTGAAKPLWEKPDDSWLPVSLYWVVSCGKFLGERPRETRNLWTNNMVIKRDIFFDVGGFNTGLGPRRGRKGYHLIAEDLEFTLRLRKAGFTAFYVPSVKCFHYVQHSEVDFRYILLRSVWIGKERRFLISLQYLTGAEAPLLIRLVRDLIMGETVTASLRSLVKSKMAITISILGAIIGFIGGFATRVYGAEIAVSG